MSKSEQVFAFPMLGSAPLVVDAIYQGRRLGHAGDDPLNSLLGVSLMGGFRYRGTLDDLELVVLTTTLSDPDWPDSADLETGILTYFGDNKKPGRALLETPRHGNEILNTLFELAHGTPEQRRKTPPVLVFASVRNNWRDMVFLGLAVPGANDLRASEDLVAVWRSVEGRRFQNYRARFTIINSPIVSRDWINDLIAGKRESPHAPASWELWVTKGERTPLRATRSKEYRSRQEQLPRDDVGKEIIHVIHEWFRERAHDFEKFAAEIARMLMPDITALDVTRASRDGGRDAVGQLRIGSGQASILLDFSLEAKCYQPGASVGVREMSRLISRLRHRQFGMLVTTSVVDTQAYKEIKEDSHPIIVLAAVDIVEILRAHGHSTVPSVSAWLKADYPTDKLLDGAT